MILCRYGPHFEDVQRIGQATNLTVQAGSSIHLNCRISLLQDKTVSLDYEILFELNDFSGSPYLGSLLSLKKINPF